MSEFRGRAAIVTGTTGIGWACALRLAAGGASVLACGIDRQANEAAAAEAGKRGFAVELRQADVSSDAEVAAAVRHAVEAFGGLDIIVNAAAIHPYGRAEETSFETWTRCMAVNVGGIFLFARHGVPEMRRRGGGAIVNISSVQGHACQAGVTAYVTSKGAVHALTRALAVDHARDGIRVNSISPGSVRTPILALAARTLDGPAADVDAVFRRFGEAHPLGRIGEPEEIAELAAFLCSDRAAFCTGADYACDGGLGAVLGVR